MTPLVLLVLEYSTNSNPSCETSIILEVLNNKLPETCNPKIISGNIDIWQKLEYSRYIFVQSETTKLTVECGRDITEANIIGTGILNLPSNCIAVCKNRELASSSNTKIYVNEIKSDFNIINNSCCNTKESLIKYSNMSPLKITNLNLEKLKNLNTMSNQMISKIDKILLDSSNNSRGILKYHPTYPIVTICILILIIVIFLCYLKKKFGKQNANRNPPITLENQQTDNNDIPLPRLRTSS